MASINQLSNGIVELSAALMIVGAYPQVSSDGMSISFCIPPKRNIDELRNKGLMTNEKYAEAKNFILNLNTYSFDSEISENELRELYKRFMSKLVRIRSMEQIFNDKVDFKTLPARKNPTIGGPVMVNYDVAVAAKAVIDCLPDAENLNKLAQETAFGLDKSLGDIKDEILRANMKNAAARVIEIAYDNQKN